MNKKIYFLLVWVILHTSFSKTVTAQLNPFMLPDSTVNLGWIDGGTNFNALILQDLQVFNSPNGSGFGGRVAIGNNFHFTTTSNWEYSFGVAFPGTGLYDVTIPTDNLIIHNQFMNSLPSNTLVSKGSVKYREGGTGTPENFYVQNGVIMPYTGDILYPNKLRNYLTSISNHLDTFTANGAFDLTGTSLTLTGTSNSLNVFDITLNETESWLEMHINTPTSATNIINITNTSLTIQSGSIYHNGVASAHSGAKTIFNFPNAFSVNLTNISVYGSIIAPTASMNVQSGDLYGQLMLGQTFFHGSSFPVHNVAFTGSVPGIEQPLSLVDAHLKLTKKQNNVTINWAFTKDVQQQQLLHSTDGKTWSLLADQNTVTELDNLAFQFEHQNPADINYYKLAYVIDEKQLESKVQKLVFKSSKNDNITVFPNPVVNSLELLVADNNVMIDELEIYTLQGVKIKSFTNINAQTPIHVADLAQGLYYINLKLGNQTTSTSFTKL